MESSLKNMVASLLSITFASALVVGLVFQTTKGPAERNRLERTNSAWASMLPEYDNAPGEEKIVTTIDGGEVTVYPAVKNNEPVGYAVETFTNKGFGGTFKLMVGFKVNGEITRIEVLEHKETPGLGDKIKNDKSNFNVQFIGKNPANAKLAVTKDGGQIDAITASTISSRAYIDAVQRAYDVLQSTKK